MLKRLATGFVCALVAAAANAATTAPAAAYRPPLPARAETAAAFLTSDAAPRYTLTLHAPTTAELASLKSSAAPKNGVSIKARRLKVGFARAGPAGDRALPLAALPWQSVSGGTAARIEVQSPTASSIRLGIDLESSDPRVALRFAGSGAPQRVYGPFLVSELRRGRRSWSPILDGDTATLEIYLPQGVSPGSVTLAIPQISHLVVAGLAPRAEPVDEIGQAASCERDIACLATPAIAAQAKAVAKMYFSEAGDSFLCTGTLVNDTLSSNTPYFLTASHCIDSQEAASTLQTYWFFDAIACGNHTVPPFASMPVGATLLARSDDYDWALLRLDHPPPAGTTLSAWNSAPINAGTQVSVMHHPEGDLKKFSQAVAAGTALTPIASGTYNVADHYSLGTTEAGSSGAALLTASASGGFELRGTLFAGSSSCHAPQEADYYSRLDLAMPLLAQYLDPNAANPGKAVVVEFYHSGLDDYFMTASAIEIHDLDTGVHPGWVRTGLRFLVYTDPALAPPGATPVCRFYVLPQFGNSHFYSADPNECAQVQARFSGQWFDETATAFYIALPNKSTGACPAGTHAVYRFLKSANQLHHRYTAEADLRNCLYYGLSPSVTEPENCSTVAGEWIEEGYGTAPNATVMCSPDS
ncbi:MAG TPA: serine protease [Casimicrobiaceae bacterium]|nr:serine protease [Casimicrobiaceae bacterium]